MTAHISSPTAQAAVNQPFYNQSLAAYSRANPIDLTGDVDDRETSTEYDRHTKRLRTNSDANKTSFCTSSAPTNQSPSPFYGQQHATVVNPSQTLSTFHHLAGSPFSSSVQHASYRPHFTGPSTSSAFFPSKNNAGLSTPPSSHGPNPLSSSQDRQIIDLTDSPSPPPNLPTPSFPVQQSQCANMPPTLDIDPKKAVCIGQLTVTALVLYPSQYLQHQRQPDQPSEAPSVDVDWAPVKLQYDFAAKARSPNAEETIHIQRPRLRAPSGELSPEETFGVVEQKVAKVIGPLLGKGLIRLEGRVRRGVPNIPILPLQLLVQTPNGNIPVVAKYFQEHGLLLDHPSHVWDRTRLATIFYLNPHNPPPGGHAKNILNPACGRPYSGPAARWSAPPVAGKSVEVQRSQVDDLFKSLKSGDELEETEPGPDISTKLYPHQKKALTFLLQREGELTGADGQGPSLWQARPNPLTGGTSWVNLVTLKESPTPPPECKGAILADDMGLGKTISCVALIAATLPSARKFAAAELTPPPKPPLERSSSSPALTAAHFAGSVWNMPDADAPAEGSMSKKKAAQAAKAHEKWEAEYSRLVRIKARSRATLIVCPLSTIANWEDQFKEHWAGEVLVTGGAGAGCITQESSMSEETKPIDNNVCEAGGSMDGCEVLPPSSQPKYAGKTSSRLFTPLRIYVYHGNSRRPDPNFLADFDAVITTYATLASEYSRQTKSLLQTDSEENLGDESGEGSVTGGHGDIDGEDCKRQTVLKKGVKRKKAFCLMNGTIETSSPLQSIHWFRVVLDEAHSIKETSTVGSRASCDLMADRRLCLTGTPVQNKLDDVYALIKFIRLVPLDDRNVWQEFIGVPVKFGQQLGVARLQTVMKCITLRRTKESKAKDGKKILSLPPRHDELRLLKFDEDEQKIYNAFFFESRDEFTRLKHKNEVMKNYVGILQKILRLRQICDHFELVDGKGPNNIVGNLDAIIDAISREGINGPRANAVFALIRDSGTAQCVECGYELGGTGDTAQTEGVESELNPAPKRGRKPKTSSRAPTRASSPVAATPRLVMSRCQHLFCMECFCNCIFPGWPNVAHDESKACTVCQTMLLPTDAAEVNPAECCSAQEAAARKKAARKERRQQGLPQEDFHPSTKVKALMGDLIVSSRMNPHSVNYDPESVEICMVDANGKELDDGIVKTVVFSQWTTMLDKIEDALEFAGIKYDRLDGTMKRDERTRAMDALKNDPACEVLLVSLKAGGVGLNLTAAQRVYLMDPYWNPAVENQAVDRIHRLGQTRPVTTIKLIVENTIEARLLEVQKRKTALANMTLGQHLSKAEALARRMEDLNQLLG